GFRLQHVHAVLIGCRHLTPKGRSQVEDYRAGLDGLAARGRDTGPRPRAILDWRQALAKHAKQAKHAKPADAGAQAKTDGSKSNSSEPPA
ncbi:MAG: hypothetical protein LBT54_05010, partial [Bifidobacteriaceae bacterium]|nr:hypothetical protein [Bifidobacteriaceae bacterium]